MADATLTHGPYCALNCGLKLKTLDGEVTGYRWRASPFSAGALCSKGVMAWKQVQHPDRLLRPLMRRGGDVHAVRLACRERPHRRGP